MKSFLGKTNGHNSSIIGKKLPTTRLLSKDPRKLPVTTILFKLWYIN